MSLLKMVPARNWDSYSFGFTTVLENGHIPAKFYVYYVTPITKKSALNEPIYARPIDV